MFSNLEKFSSASKAQFESQFSAFNVLANKALAVGEKVIAVNTAAAKAYLDDSKVVAQQLLSAKDPQAFFALVSTQAKQGAAKAAVYGHQLTEVISSAKADLTKAAEQQIADGKNQVVALVDQVTKSAPAGSEKAVEMLKSVIGSANDGYDQLTKTSKQAVEAVEAQVAKATNQLTQSTKQAVEAVEVQVAKVAEQLSPAVKKAG